jgi:hypothetical protein
LGDKIKEGDVSAACDMYGGYEQCIGRGKILKQTLNKLNGRMGTGAIWFRGGTNGGLL